MKISFTKNGIFLEKDLNKYDSFVLEFLESLPNSIKYAIMSGYPAILFGRERLTEDIDMFIERITQDEFERLWAELDKKFYCINTSEMKDAFAYLVDGLALRFAKKGTIAPNFEIKYPKDDLDRYTLNHGIEVTLNGKRIIISPLELQIAYKLYLGSDKDIEDARYLYILFKKKIKTDELTLSMRKLNLDIDKMKVLE